jgi:uncharacterized protein YbcI
MTDDAVAIPTNEQDDRSTSHGSGGPGGSVAQRIAKGMVVIYKEHLGRGPTKARTTLHENMVVTVLSDSLTKAELTLIAKDKGDAVRDIRRLMQEAMEGDMRKLIETELHRETVAFLSDHCPKPDYAVEILLLAPE